MRALFITSACLLSLGAVASADPVARGGVGAPSDLAPGVRIEADGTWIDVEIGHAAPFVVDWDGDGLNDLLVGQFGSGRLRIHRNAGEPAAPRLGAPTFFEAGGQVAEIPAG